MLYVEYNDMMYIRNDVCKAASANDYVCTHGNYDNSNNENDDDDNDDDDDDYVVISVMTSTRWYGRRFSLVPT